MLIDKIKADSLTARKERNEVATKLLLTLYSEAAMVGKNNGNRASTDAEVIAVIKKFVKNSNETLSLVPKESTAFSDVSKELEILDSYLPKQLSSEELKSVVTEIAAGIVNPNMGQIMSVLKSKYEGQYDGKVASMIVKQVMGAI